VLRLERLGRLYGLSAPAVLASPPTIDLRNTGGDDGTVADGGATAVDGTGCCLDLTRLHDAPGEEAGLLRRLARAIEVARGDYNGRLLSLRDIDVEIAAAFLDMAAHDLRRLLDQLGLRFAPSQGALAVSTNAVAE
jgi:hypothetical protein